MARLYCHVAGNEGPYMAAGHASKASTCGRAHQRPRRRRRSTINVLIKTYASTLEPGHGSRLEGHDSNVYFHYNKHRAKLHSCGSDESQVTTIFVSTSACSAVSPTAMLNPTKPNPNPPPPPHPLLIASSRPAPRKSRPGDGRLASSPRLLGPPSAAQEKSGATYYKKKKKKRRRGRRKKEREKIDPMLPFVTARRRAALHPERGSTMVSLWNVGRKKVARKHLGPPPSVPVGLFTLFFVAFFRFYLEAWSLGKRVPSSSVPAA